MAIRCSRCQTVLPQGSPDGICPACLMSMAQSPTANAPGVSHASVEQLQGRIPGIELRSLIGTGGMGAVYLGYQVDLEREVAVKVLPTAMFENPVFQERFRREAQALAKLDHPNIVTVFGSGVNDGLCYIVMEHVEGTTLRDAMNAEAIDPGAALKIVPQICEALAYAHRQGVVHRDIKPENILLGTGDRVKVVDFGLAKISESDTQATMLTATGATLGTLRYMAPEQLDGTAVDHRADVYSLGVVFYEMLTGQVPMGQFPLPSEKAGTDPRIDDVIMRTLAREPEQRYQEASQIESELESLGDGTVESYGWTGPQAMQKRSFPPGQWLRIGREWKSKSTFLGFPLIHLAYGHNPRTGEKLVAKGLIAIGDVAVGGLAMGGVSLGIVSSGGCAFGITAAGGVAIGLQLAAGGAAIGALALGGAAVGLIAFGGGAIGYIALGGGAVGRFAIGGGAAGTNVFDWRGKWTPAEAAETSVGNLLTDPALPIYGSITTFAMTAGPLLLILVCYLIGKKQSESRGVVEQPMPKPAKRNLTGTLISQIILLLLLPTAIMFIQVRMFSRLLQVVTP